MTDELDIPAWEAMQIWIDRPNNETSTPKPEEGTREKWWYCESCKENWMVYAYGSTSNKHKHKYQRVHYAKLVMPSWYAHKICPNCKKRG